MPPRCPLCAQFYREGTEHVCRKPGPRPRGDARWRSDSPEAKAYRAEYARNWNRANPGYGQRYYDERKSARERLRIAALFAYGGDPPRCACCGETTIQFLTIDHRDGGGNEARKAEGHRGGTQQYRRLRMAGWPAGYRVLCWNCNAAIGLYGRCPHEVLAGG